MSKPQTTVVEAGDLAVGHKLQVRETGVFKPLVRVEKTKKLVWASYLEKGKGGTTAEHQVGLHRRALVRVA